MKKINKYDIVIYSCLILAIICLILGGRDYLNSQENKSNIKDEVKSAIKNINPEEEISPTENNNSEPEELTKIDKNSLLKNYLNSILNHSTVNEVITPDIINSWGTYEILDLTYERKVADNYYQYLTYIKISNKNGKIPGNINKDKSTEENPVLEVNAYLEYSPESNNYFIKYLDI
ncbi:MAG TPA: hypothetical protein IAC02_03185 [Candidatus Coprovivens excrementavium]|nr:hypothetical protein [Candidatus Coprovivens excrementavium]